MEKYIEQFIPSQCRVVKDGTSKGTINLEGEALIFNTNGIFLGTASASIGFIKEKHIDTAIELLKSYKESLNSREKPSCRTIKFDFKSKFKQGGQP